MPMRVPGVCVDSQSFWTRAAGIHGRIGPRLGLCSPDRRALAAHSLSLEDERQTSMAWTRARVSVTFLSIGKAEFSMRWSRTDSSSSHCWRKNRSLLPFSPP